MTAQQAREIAAAYTNPRVQPWYQELMDRIDTAAKNQNTRIPIMLREDQKQFLASEGYVVEEYAISWDSNTPSA